MSLKSLKSNFVVKCIAVILFAVFLTATLLSSACIVFGIASGTFASEAERIEYKNEILQNGLRGIASDLRNYVRLYAETDDDAEDMFTQLYISENVMIEIENSQNEIIYSSMDESEYSLTYSDLYTVSVLKSEYRGQEITEYETEIYYDDYDDTDYGEPATSVNIDLSKYYEEKTYSITVYLKDELTVKDGFYYLGELFDFIAENEIKLLFTAIISAVMSVAFFIFLMCASGHKAEVEGISISRFDRFPVDVLTVIYAGLTFLLGWGIFLMEDATYNMVRWYYDAAMITTTALCIIGVVIDFVLLAILSMTTAVRLKTRTFIKSTLIFMGLKLFYKIIKKTWETIVKCCKKSVNFTGRVLRKIPLVWKTIIIVIAIWFLELFIVACGSDFLPLLFVINAVLGVAVILIAIILKQIKNGTEEIAKGNIYKKINTKYMFLDFKDHAENINNINDGIAKAVEERMKSERFKTELITNVSHDIKTPLTSIINYVDLLEKEEINNETAKDYVAVLSRQSARLKKLIEDLLEASKASTGNVGVNLSKFELGILLSQALGEYEERFSKNNLQVVLNKTDELLLVMADNRHMWRVFDNILNNIAKYAQPGTRVYINANRRNKIAEISFRNISKDPLNISGDELMERFVRGDSSRNTEGSGLGLSIAKSLTEVQKGKLDIQIDGDLFKIRLAFPLSE